MTENFHVPHGTPALIILKTLDPPGPFRGHGIARPIKQIRGDLPVKIEDLS